MRVREGYIQLNRICDESEPTPGYKCFTRPKEASFRIRNLKTLYGQAYRRAAASTDEHSPVVKASLRATRPLDASVRMKRNIFESQQITNNHDYCRPP